MTIDTPELARPIPRMGKGRRRLIEGAFIAGFWALFAMLTLVQQGLDPRFRGLAELGGADVAHAGLKYSLWAILTPGIFWLCRHFRLEGGVWIRHLFLYLAIAIVAALTISTFSYELFHTLHAESERRPFSLGRVFFGLRFFSEFILFLAVLGAGFARDYFLRYQERQEETARLRADAAQLQAQLLEARLQSLRMQINPHFLFNTLHTISTYVERDPRGVRRMIARLSELLRYTLDMNNTKEVPLRQELEFLDRYLDIQSIRFEDNLVIERDVEADVMDALVPTLILQPLVENAIKHGVSKVTGQGIIKIRARREGEHLHLSVQDNGPGLSEPGGDGARPPSSGIGLRNTQERLDSLYGDKQQLLLEPAKGGGLVARIILPFHTGSDLYTTAVSA